MTFETPASERAPAAPEVNPALHPVRQVWTTPVRRPSGAAVALAIIGIVVAGAALLLVLVYLSTFLGPGALLICLALALVPLSVILLAVRWIDRWEPEPRPALWFALLWGAGVSVVSALVFDLGVKLALAATGAAATGDGADFVTGVIQAPIVEETAKGAGILLLFWAMRRRFDGPVDGVVYAATIAAGFAFSENIQYFGVAMIEGGAQTLGFTFLVRGVLSPFAHVMFTACTGIAFGLAARRRAGRAAGTVLLGLISAIALHALWNGAFYLLVGDTGLISYYLLVQVPLFITAVVVVVLLRRQEERITKHCLMEYAAAGWFSTAEVEMLATPQGRRQARGWAAGQPRDRRTGMQDFITDATRLAFARQRMLNGSAGNVDRADEAQLLALVQHDRAAVVGAAGPVR
ncbi:RsiW-degrading membrane proteinase PrsW (M82 family) [Cryobacterium sp. MP_M5]|uniref:PrsW family intramembrane metalloprotease n=1 Tax=unclassified Cryobacterium TaxID=2649013 RepID=UPI0018C9AE4F|nr:MULTISPECIES: PrsW family intramembrane metalloprotease [unclassified Cryobacterium]MBG6057376.1 RsiW-degrading membrane proteinase PrsW (M82 family) [Cryobacterium sp. MP_M3]MEC5175575.1 RsiW-degrading membrane proteinase PrsW (M82 family) [Cryobacterium sp. MP_M5]